MRGPPQRGQAAAGPGISVVRLLAVAAVLGVGAGVVLSRTRHRDDDLIETATSVVDEVLPEPAPPPVRRGEDMMAPDPLSLRGVPAYPGASPRKITGARPGANLNAISWFATADSVDRVLSYYEEIYTRSNMLYTSHRWGQKSGYVSWFEHARNPDGGMPIFGDGVLHMVSAFHDASTTTVLVSATDPMATLRGLKPLPAGISLPDGATPQVVSSGEAGAERISIFAALPTMSREELAADLEHRMRGAGWELTERLVSPEGRVSLVGKLKDRVQIAVVDRAEDGNSQVLITLEEK